jgi:UDP-N-acetylmuramoyl-tripeptide--D-alanyl-D-alanine ligase
MSPKKTAKKSVATILGWQVRRLRKRHQFQIVAVAGSIGKTSTKLAVARVLSHSFRVRWQEGNYNDIVSVPLIFFDEKIPNLLNPISWLIVFIRNEIKIIRNYPYDVVVVEVGTDGPGQIAGFSRYLHADIGVLTAIAPEHMAYFEDLDAVAKEESALADFSSLILVNKDLCAPKYVSKIKTASLSYAINQSADFTIKNIKFSGFSCDFDVYRIRKLFFKAKHELVAEPQLYSVLAATAVAAQLGMNPVDIETGLHEIKPVSGRMQRLRGIKDSVIIDDSYNASPRATIAALDTLYRIKSPQRIAVLGNMNELGEFSKAEHEKVGKHCDPKKLDLVVTIGPDANKYLAPAANAKKCKVLAFEDPYSAGRHLRSVIKKDAVILVKGSQNKVFAEETAKLILADLDDSSKLVRQTAYWLKVKRKAFKQI